MESLAQKKAKANFKKAIAYRKKTGCSLKEAFAHVQGKKVGAVKKRSSSPLKKKVAKKAVKKTAKKAISTHKDTKSHNVNIKVMSGIGANALANVSYLVDQIKKAEGQYEILKRIKKEHKILDGFSAKLYQRYPAYIRSLKRQLTEAKKHIH